MQHVLSSLWAACASIRTLLASFPLLILNGFWDSHCFCCCFCCCCCCYTTTATAAATAATSVATDYAESLDELHKVHFLWTVMYVGLVSLGSYY